MYGLAQLNLYEQLKRQARRHFLCAALLINLFGLQINVFLSK